MSRIGQVQEQKRMREQIAELERLVGILSRGLDALIAQTQEEAMQLRAAIAALAPIENAVESRRGPGRPRKEHGERIPSRSD